MSLDEEQRGIKSDLSVAEIVSRIGQSSSRQAGGCLTVGLGALAELGAYESWESGKGELALVLGLVGAVVIWAGIRGIVRG